MLNNIPIIKDNEPMKDTKFYQWLKETKDTSKRFVDSVKDYMGGDKDKAYFKNRPDMLNHKYVFENFWFNEVRGLN